jgi:hypothetical protein
LVVPSADSLVETGGVRETGFIASCALGLSIRTSGPGGGVDRDIDNGAARAVADNIIDRLVAGRSSAKGVQVEAGSTASTDAGGGIPADTSDVGSGDGSASAGSSEVVSSVAGGAEIASGVVVNTISPGRHGDALVNDVEGYPVAVAGLALDAGGQSVLLAPLNGLVGRADTVVKVGSGPADLTGVVVGVEDSAVWDGSVAANGHVFSGVDEKTGVAKDAIVLGVVSGHGKVVLAVGKRRETGVAVRRFDQILDARGAGISGGAVGSAPGDVVVDAGNALVGLDEHSVDTSNAVASGVNS